MTDFRIGDEVNITWKRTPYFAEMYVSHGCIIEVAGSVITVHVAVLPRLYGKIACTGSKLAFRPSELTLREPRKTYTLEELLSS